MLIVSQKYYVLIYISEVLIKFWWKVAFLKKSENSNEFKMNISAVP
jgi:hypothetical protein